MSDQQPDTTTGDEVVKPAKKAHQGGGVRLALLLAILIGVSFAAWYDYRVARPAVDHAFHRVDALNRRINAAPGRAALTSNQVQQAVGFPPSGSKTIGKFRVEVYKWTAGLPFMSHAYYAVYSGRGDRLTFKSHYKHLLPDEELTPKLTAQQLADIVEAAQAPGPSPAESIGDQWEADGGLISDQTAASEP